MKRKILNNKILLILLLLFLTFHVINLTLLPIFNDEAIYLDWAWSHTHMPGHLYDSLLDAKQPFIIWIFAIFQNFFQDPLFAGRIASVLIGAISLTGFYLSAKIISNRNTAIIASLVFAVIPIVVFYNRQALMEAGVVCIGIWSFFWIVKFIKKPKIVNAINLGVILGIGFMIKSSTLIFLASAGLIIFYYIFRKNNKELFKPSLFLIVAFVAVNAIIFINPVFWENFSTNSRYSLSISEIFQFPFNVWMNNISALAEISFIYFTPTIFISGLLGVYLMVKSKNNYSILYIAYFAISLFLILLSARGLNQRYLVPFIALLIMPASVFLNSLWSRELWGKIVVIFIISVPLFVSIAQIYSPDFYILQTSKISRYADDSYIRGQTSGYGTREAILYIKNKASYDSPNMVLFGLNLGNPENAVNLYSSKDEKLYGMRIDANFFPNLDKIDCFTSDYPAFFVTRNDQLFGLDKYFKEVKSFPNPYVDYSVKIYSIKDNCEGNTLSLSQFYQPVILRIDQFKLGIY